jgi:hypothetical protein
MLTSESKKKIPRTHHDKKTCTIHCNRTSGTDAFVHSTLNNMAYRMIIGLSMMCLSQSPRRASGASAAHAFLDGGNDDDRRRYHFDSERYHDDDDEEQEDDEGPLIHIPMRSRASVLRERNLLHLLEEERMMMDEDATATFARWARSDGDDGEKDNNSSRRLQEFSGEGTHFLNAYVGSPAQKRVLAISSAADFTAFPCEVRVEGGGGGG